MPPRLRWCLQPIYAGALHPAATPQIRPVIPKKPPRLREYRGSEGALTRGRLWHLRSPDIQLVINAAQQRRAHSEGVVVRRFVEFTVAAWI